jgi:hypothetical protein
LRRDPSHLLATDLLRELSADVRAEAVRAALI